MRYTITVEHDRKRYRYTIEHIPIDQRREHFKLIARNKTLTIESNRPLFRNKGLKHRRYDLKVIGEAQIWNREFMAKIYEQIEKIVKLYLEQ
ncbi:MAG TPA: hypothetical protein VGN63_19615 [Flavisolibacter sp.]|nr:hypothetical protein [Flavisolibacter sp.]